MQGSARLNIRINDTLAYPKTAEFGPNFGGYNVLTFYKTLDQFWTECNQPFLDAAVARGDEMILSTRPTAAELLNGKTGKLTGSGREFRYLIDKGYKYEPASSKMVEVGKTAGGK